MFRTSRNFLQALTICGVLLAGSAPGVYAQNRISDKDLENLMRNLKDDAKSFRPSFESDLKKSTIRRTSKEKEAKSLAVRFEKETEGMFNYFKNKKNADSQLPVVRSTAQQIDAIVTQVGVGRQTASRWDKIQAELRQISSAFGIQTSALSGDYR